MNTLEGRPPLIKQGWLRVLLFFLAFFTILLIIVIPIGLVIAFLNKDAIARGEQINVTELLKGQYLWFTVLVSLVVSLVSVFLFRRFIDRKSLMSLGFELTGYLKEAGTGFFLAPLILGLGTLILYFSKDLEWMDVDFNGSELFIGFGIMMMVAIGEEVVFRGYILNNLMESFSRWIALILSAILFTLFHLANPGVSLISLINIFLAGILMGINYVYTKNLWFSILFHLSWNFFQGPLLGYKVSGVNLPPLLQTELNGDQLLTGAEFGFEGSVIDLAITLVAILCLFLVYEKKFAAKGELSLRPQ